MERCSFYHDGHVAANATRCSTHNRHPIACAEELQAENAKLLELLAHQHAEKSSLILQIRAIREYVGKQCDEASTALDRDAQSGGNGMVYGSRLRAFQEIAQKIDAGDFTEKRSPEPQKNIEEVCPVCWADGTPCADCGSTGKPPSALKRKDEAPHAVRCECPECKKRYA